MEAQPGGSGTATGARREAYPGYLNGCIPIGRAALPRLQAVFEGKAAPAANFLEKSSK